MANSRMFTNDFSEYDGSKRRGTIQTFKERFPAASYRLEGPKIKITDLDKIIAKRVERGESKYFIVHQTTTTTEGTKFFRNYERWNVNTLMNASKMKGGPEVIHSMKRLLDDDCIGLTDRPVTDTLCYTPTRGLQILGNNTILGDAATATFPTTVTPVTPTITTASLRSSASSASATTTSTTGDTPDTTADTPTTGPAAPAQTLVPNTQFLATDFHRTLLHYQTEMYIALRCNIQHYMDENASIATVNFIEREQRELNKDETLTDKNFFHRDRRLKWKTIKEFVLEFVCRKPLEGDRFLELRQIKRDDKSTVAVWLNKVHDVKRDVDLMGIH